MSTKLTAEYARSVLNYDPSSGDLTWTERVALRIQIGDNAGWEKSDGYREVSLLNRSYKVHRVIFLIVTGEWPKFHVDHINGVRNDNRWENLRDVTRQVNNQNQRNAHLNSVSGTLGVQYLPRLKHNPFQARIRVKGKPMVLGCFPTSDLAHAAYLEAKRSLHEGCTI